MRWFSWVDLGFGLVWLPNRELRINSDLPSGVLFKEMFKKVIV